MEMNYPFKDEQTLAKVTGFAHRRIKNRWIWRCWVDAGVIRDGVVDCYGNIVLIN